MDACKVGKKFDLSLALTIQPDLISHIGLTIKKGHKPEAEPGRPATAFLKAENS